MPSFGAEDSCVQNPLIGYVAEPEIGWTCVSREESEERRGGLVQSFFFDTLGDKLLALNHDILDKELAAQVMQRMQNVRPTIEGNATILSFLRGEQSIYHPIHKRELNFRVIDFDNLDNNDFDVTGEWSYSNGKFTNRADIVFLINGVPIIVVETKAAHKLDGVAEGMEQIRRYHRETPGLMTHPQIFDVPNLLDWFYGVTWSTDRKNLFNWKDEQQGNYEKKVKAVFNRERILRFIKDYILFVKKDDDLKKFILRQHQVRAVEKVVERALDKDKLRGLVWHTQGSGKTFTMISSAEQLIHRPELEKPTVLVLIDRNELETQLFQNLEAYGFGGMIVAERKTHLRELMKSGHRGLIVSMIHKFEGMPENINTAANIIVLIDEAHRTTAGDLGNYLMAALPNATYIGFTGTPIDKTAKGSGTFKVFGIDDVKGYLDKYSMAESIDDGTTLRLNYTIAPNDMLVDQETLEKEFLSLAEAEGMSDIEELNKILERAVTLKTQLKAKDRVEKVAAFVAEHFTSTIEPMGFKAFLVGVDREACALYKKELDKHLPAEYSTVVYSQAHNDREHLKEFYLTEADEKKVRKEFAKKSTIPKILIVTEKLLTGYDAPILYCMYLDKPMRDHVLLQTIARVNRPYEDGDGLKKPAGFVLDFVGIFDKLQRALAFDSDEVASVINDIALLKDTFAQLIQEQAGEYLDLIPKGKATDKDCERAIENFDDKEQRNTFFKFFRQVESLYEIISPDVFLRPYIDDYNRLLRLYCIIRNAFTKRIYIDKEFMAKTAKLIRDHVTTDSVDAPLPVQKIDEQTLEALKASQSSDTVKVINLIKTITATVDEEEDEIPILGSIGEKAEAIAELYDNRQISTQDALLQLESLVTEYNTLKSEWQKKGMSAHTFNIYWAIHRVGLEDAEGLAVKVNEEFESYSHYRDNRDEQMELRRKLYKLLLKPVGKDKIKEITDHLMKIRMG
ncbi:MAG: HsdR family type I site-specific deoxyribonuclease [Deltaproteobacteria bacterium]|nr:HsdR family type I site-specific deoxyribonuclease [Deltaproteobacteria bacterium]